MAVVNTFCFWFSVRLGSMIIGLLTLVQATICLMYLLLVRNRPEEFLDHLRDFFTTIHLDNQFLKDLLEDPNFIIITGTTFFVCLLISCILLLFGTFQVRANYAYAFILFYLLYIIFLIMVVVIFMLWIKAEGNGLGDLILYSNLAGFILLFYMYTWGCVLSFVQIINELRERVKMKLKARKAQKLPEKLNRFPRRPVIGYNYINYN